ncbi:MAG: SPOR domain-containing protein, partial [Acidobacteria bacterium]|nr:SPOR domain-containing protein [Acidobacteriota bacterium]
ELADALRQVAGTLALDTPVPTPARPLPVVSRVSALLTRTNLLGVTVVAAVLALGILMQQSQSAPDSSPPGTGASALPSRPVPVTSDLSAGFYLRVASFGDQAEAIEQANRLRRLGYSPWVVPRRQARNLLRRSYEVRVGPYARSETASAQKQQLERQGFRDLSVVEEKASR